MSSSARRCPEAGRISLRRGGLMLLTALLLSGIAGRRVVHAAPISFQPPVSYDMPGGGWAVPVDLDGDGKIDLAVAGDGQLSLLFGRGDGTFGDRIDMALGGLNQPIAADVNGDGLPDLVI